MGISFISIEDLYKTFKNADGNVEVLKGINLELEQGDIFGIVGFSGAGKSTLIRCLNRLEKPDCGRIWIGEHEITALS